jgi:hypothetical protein
MIPSSLKIDRVYRVQDDIYVVVFEGRREYTTYRFDSPPYTLVTARREVQSMIDEMSGKKKKRNIPAVVAEGLQSGAAWAAGSRLFDKATKWGKKKKNPKKPPKGAKRFYGPNEKGEDQKFWDREEKRIKEEVRESDDRAREQEQVYQLMKSAEYKKLESMYLEAYTPYGGNREPYSGLLDDARKFALKKLGVKNPNPSTLKEAEELTEKWHGRKSQKITEVEEIENYQEEVAELADLEELGVLGADLASQFTISFKTDRPKLCATDDNNLEFVGGDQSLKNTDDGIKKDGKMLVPLGYCYQIVYETDKHHLEGSNGYPESYEHYFGEEFYKESIDPDDFKNSSDWFEKLLEDGVVEEAVEEGLLPMLVYNKTDQKLLLVGGKYTVEDVGIRN